MELNGSFTAFDYEATVSASATSHVIPANTLASSESGVSVAVLAQNITTSLGTGAEVGSAFLVLHWGESETFSTTP